MAYKVLGISGSPTQKSNTDALIEAILEATGAEAEFVKLSEVKVGPCLACRKCSKTNQCVVEDDFRALSKKLLEADALVLGSPVMYRAASAFMKAFVERQYSLRHVKLMMQGKLGAAVAVGEVGADTVVQWLEYTLLAGGMEVVGTMHSFGNPGCFVCGNGETCRYSIWNSIAKKEGSDNFYMKNYHGYLEALPDHEPFGHPSYKVRRHRNVRDEPVVMAQAVAIGKTIKARLAEKQGR
jgi:multimeric flavodoxin WrbA